MAEWPIASVLKTEVLKGTVGSNPTSSVPFIFNSVNFYFAIEETINNLQKKYYKVIISLR